MRYVGGKSLIAGHIVNQILSDTYRRQHIIEPFMGGGAVTRELAPKFSRMTASDIHGDLVAMWQALQHGWDPPNVISKELFVALRKAPSPSCMRGFAGFACAMFGDFFSGYAADGKGTNYAQAAGWALRRDVARMENVQFLCRSYRDVRADDGDVVYCDPPYAGVSGYRGVDGGAAFDSTDFWHTAEGWAEQGAHVYVSEYRAPAGWEAIWIRRRTRAIRERITVEEKLFICKRFHRL